MSTTKVERACGHFEDFPPPKHPSFLEKKLTRFRSRLCAACAAAKQAASVAREQAAAALVRQGKHAALLEARRLEVYGALPDHLRDALRLTYLQISNLSNSEAVGLVALRILEPEDLSDKSAKQLASKKAAVGWTTLGKVLERLAAGGIWFRMGYEPRHGDWFASHRSDDEWLGMRGGSLPLAVCKLLLMIHFEAWPPTRKMIREVRS